MANGSLPPIIDVAPTDQFITDYDRSHAATYLRLLDAEKDGAPWAEVAQIVLGVDTTKDQNRARRIYDSHLARAQWIATHGYRELMKSAR